MNDICTVKLTLKIKLSPDSEQFNALKNTLKESNSACNEISKCCFEKKIWGQYKIHHETYYSIKSAFNLSSQMVVRCISKVADTYKREKKVQHTFKTLGGVTYDSRVLTFKQNEVSIWTVVGRLKIPFVCHNQNYIPYIKGEADLVFKKGKFYLFQSVEVPEEQVVDIEEFIGCDFGLINICTLSSGESFSSTKLEEYRRQKIKVRSSIQRKGTKSSKRLLKRLSGRERTFGTLTNHTISKQIVELAKSQNKGIAIEDLKGIRNSANKKGKDFKARVSTWSFYQLRQFLAYKALLNGVQLVDVKPAYTSKTCHNCFHIGKRQGKRFTCKNCNSIFDADYNAAKNIALLGASVIMPEGESLMYCEMPHLISKTQTS